MACFLKDEIRNIICVLLYGAVLAAIYDIIGCIRYFVRHNIIFISVEDMLFWVLASVTTLKLMIGINDGGLRMYLCIGMVFGAGIYYHVIHWGLKKLRGLFKIKNRKRGGDDAKRRKKI